ncbi:hypothetical protein BDR22DRAFT_146042 [Usnea florida]
MLRRLWLHVSPEWWLGHLFALLVPKLKRPPGYDHIDNKATVIVKEFSKNPSMVLPPYIRAPRPASLNSTEDDYFNGIWDQALKECQDQIGPYDYQNVDRFSDLDEFLGSVRQRTDIYRDQTIPVLLNKLEPCLGRLQGFISVMAIVLRGPAIRTGIIWGVLNLLIELSRSSIIVLSKIVEMLDQMVHFLSIFQEYEWIYKENPDLEETLIRAFADMIGFWSGVIHFLKRHPAVNFAITPWQNLQTEFHETSEQIQRQTARVKERAQARALQRSQPDLLREFDARFSRNMTLTQSKFGDPDFSCTNVPWPKDPNFYGRETILAELHQKLDHQPTNPELRSWALWGLAGIGKTQIALTYAYERLAEGVPAVFWIKGDTALNIDTSFTEIALKLGLEGAVENGDHEHNRFLVTSWLREASLNWLIIFDNVDNPNNLRNRWPPGKHGSILITSRSQVVCNHPAAGGYLVPCFTAQEGSQCLMKLLARGQYSEEEQASANAFSDVLGGLPLALLLMGTQIRKRGKQIQQFLIQYEKNPARLHQTPKTGIESLYYDRGLDTVWQETFGSLEPESLAILGTMSLLAADDIPYTLFVSEHPDLLPSSLSFCSDEISFDDALLPLQESSLVRKNPESGMIYIHRLVQEEFGNWSGTEKCFEYFRDAAKVLLEAFPRHQLGMGLRNSWVACQQAVGHVLSLCDRYRHARYTPAPGDLQDFAQLLTSCGWYLMEKGLWGECMELIATAELVCEDKEGLVWAHICNTAGIVEYERGNVARSYPYMNKSREIRERLLPEGHMELSDMLNNYGNLLITESESEASLAGALELYQRAEKIDNAAPLGEKVLHIRHINIGAVYGFQGKYDLAIKHYELARKYAKATFKGRHFQGRVEYLTARNWYRQGDWERAKASYERALKIFEDENATHHGVAATELKLACIDLKLGKIDDAIERLQKAKLVAELNEKGRGDQGDTARMLRRLAEAYDLKGRHAEAATMREKAESIRRKVQGERFDALPDTEGSYDLMVFHGDR